MKLKSFFSVPRNLAALIVWAALIAELPDGTFIVSNKRGTALVDTMMDMFLMLCGSLVLLIPMTALFFKKPAAMSAFDFRPLQPFRKKKRDDKTDDLTDEQTDETK